MPKIVLITRTYFPTVGGISSYIYDMYSQFGSDEVNVIAFVHLNQEEFDATSRYKTFRTPGYSRWFENGKWAMIPLFFTAFGRLMVTRGIQEIHAEQVQSGLVVFLLSKIFRKPYRIFAHGMEVNTSDRWGFKRMVFSHSKTVIANSRYTRELLIRLGIDAGKIIIFTPGVPKIYYEDASGLSLSKSRKELGIPTDNKILLTIARLDATSRYKGIDTMIRAMPLIIRQHSHIHYYIAGSGPDSGWYEELARQSHLERYVTLVGSVSEEVKKKYLAACDVFVLPNRIEYERGGEITEGFGIVFIEASIFGKPVIGGDGGARDAVEDGVSGYYVDPHSAEAVASKVNRLLEDPVLAKALGEQGRERALRLFDSEEIARTFTDFIRKNGIDKT